MIAVNVVDKTAEVICLSEFRRGKLLADQHMAIHGGNADLRFCTKTGLYYVHDIVAANADKEVGRFALGIGIADDDRFSGEIDQVAVSLNHHRTV